MVFKFVCCRVDGDGDGHGGVDVVRVHILSGTSR